jgi:inner membrane protein
MGSSFRLMPTVMTHAIVPIALGLAAGRRHISPRITVAGIALAMLPDADVIGFKLGIDYADQWGHRGASHSLLLAAMVAGLVAKALGPQQAGKAFLFLFLSMASHGLLDTLTNGGLGAALFWPFDDGRFHAPITPIAVSPIGMSDFLSARGLAVLKSEMIWVWSPVIVLLGLALSIRRFSPSR